MKSFCTSYSYSEFISKMRQVLEMVILVSLSLAVTSSFPDQKNVITYCVSENGSCDQNVYCVGSECRPLMWFVSKSHTIPNDSIIVFLPGNHSLRGEQNNRAIVNFSNIDNLTLKASISNSNNSYFSKIICNGYAGFRFQNSSNIRIKKLTFQQCGIPSLNQTSSDSALYFMHTTNISLSHLTIMDSVRLSLSIVTFCEGYINIINSLFKRCSLSACEYSDNVLVKFDLNDCPCNHVSRVLMTLNDSIVSFGNRETKGRGFILKIMQPEVNVEIHNVTFSNGTTNESYPENRPEMATFGGNVEIDLLVFESKSSKVKFENSQVFSGSALHGGGVYINFGPHKRHHSNSSSSFLKTNTEVSFITTTFHRNSATVSHSSGGGLFVSHIGQIGLCFSQSKLTMIDCTFAQNWAKTAVAMLISQAKLPKYIDHFEPQLLVTLDNCTFHENHLTKYYEQTNEDGIVDLYSVSMMIIRNSIFANNNGTALLMMNSAVQFEGENTFLNNSAYYGGAIRVCENSLIYLTKTQVWFENNTAQIAGGAIYAGDHCLEKNPRCFYQPVGNLTKEDLNGSLTFINNSATYAGGAIYGGSVDHCFTRNTITSKLTSHTDGTFFRAIFNIMPNISSMVTSDPYGVCMCNPITGEPNCTHQAEKQSLTKYPGEKFVLNVTAVGQTRGPVHAIVNVSIASHSNSTLRVYDYDKYDLSIKCQTIPLTVLSKPDKSVTLQISVVPTNPAKEHSNYYHIRKLHINVTIAPCRWLFQLNESNGCDCNKILKYISEDVKCDINKKIIKKPTKLVWFHCIDGDFSCKKLEGNDYCKYCNNKLILSQSNFSEQCIEGRHGRLCGSCESNYTLSLGFQKCVETSSHCSVRRLVLLLFAFLVSAIVMMLFLAIFNLTVAEGAINGILLFANCVQANQESFFKQHESSFFLQVFISWLNLDFGFQVCFYSGMTAYHKFWLECGFLAYLFLLGVLIVCLSHRYIWFTRLIGRNMVAVLSTVMLFAYPKLVRLALKGVYCRRNIFSSEKNYTSFHWYEDETIDCFTGKHIPVFIFSLLMLIVALLYMMSLMFFQCLQRRSGWRVLRWVNSLRPFFDTNTGPYRDNYRFWPGLLNLIKFGVLLESTFIISKKKRILLLTTVCIFMFFLVLVFPRGMYKKWPLSILEVWILLCLGMAALFIFGRNSYFATIADTSVGIVAAIFALILVYQLYKRVQNTQIWKKIVALFYSKRKEYTPLIDNNVEENEDTPVLEPQVVMPDMADLREPILEDD